MNYIELRKLSLEFRRLSSNLLNSNDDNADVNLSRFLSYITKNEFIKRILEQKISGIEYDFKQCFQIETNGWSDFNIPTDEACHLKAQYDYMIFINETDKINVTMQAMNYCWSDRKVNVMIQKFLNKSFKPLIDFINDQISMEMIAMDEDRKANLSNTFIQNIETLNGTANQQANGTINNYNTNNDISSILSLINKIIPSLSSISDIDNEEIDNVKDDLEVIQEQLTAPTPKKSRINKALAGIKKFIKDFSMKLSVSLATSAVTKTDWTELIQQVEDFLTNI
ncbi:MAG: hypothetical protein IKW30_06705 [Lachnospiraceae bacterium]|nr:hypothetical protein [Lachnospiraceae bacterium]